MKDQKKQKVEKVKREGAEDKAGWFISSFFVLASPFLSLAVSSLLISACLE